MIERTHCYYKNAPAGNWKPGHFLAWSTETFEHAEEQLFTEPVAIIEDLFDGKIQSVSLNWIQFNTPQ